MIQDVDLLNAWDKRLTTAEIGRAPAKPRLYHYSEWFSYIHPGGRDLELLLDEDSLTGRTFRNRFGLPWIVYHDTMLAFADEHFPLRRDCTGKEPVPLQYKVLGQLRMLRTGMTFDCIAEITRSGFRGEVHRLFCHRFWSAFVTKFWHLWIRPPSTEREIEILMEPYKRAGCDGGGGSTAGFNVEVSSVATSWVFYQTLFLTAKMQCIKPLSSCALSTVDHHN